ncbi:MAG: 1-acyl-sn-glycerol-3-phosphate acyltransferase [Solobacterium sp.]|nr:1-acyl-sn-glycerol-3-phosphate acyltransferase [Solobacterium sp.]
MQEGLFLLISGRIGITKNELWENGGIMTRDQVFKIVRWLYDLLTHVTVENEHLMPKDGPVIITLNHLSRVDFPALIMVERINDIYCVASDSYRNYPVFGMMINDADMIWIDRTKADFAAMKRIMTVLKEGKIIALAPEGTRSKTQALLEGKEGVTLIASKSRVPLISMAVIGTEKWMDAFKHFHKPRITLRFGPTYELPRIDPDNREESLRAATDEVMCRIAALLPDHYHGFYRDNPRIRELREEWRSRGDMILPEE